MKNIFGGFPDICKMIKIEHSVFALPYAWTGAFLAARGLPDLWTLFFLTVAMVAVRSFAMTVNRIADVEIDGKNPRTQKRPLVTGAISMRQANLFSITSAAVFIGACACLNLTCLVLSVPALLFSAAYSWLKRFTPWCHFWLGATLGLAPIGGWLAVQPASLGLSAILLFFAVTFWVGAFDVYYAFQDLEFDCKNGLFSIPATLGPATAMVLAGFTHALTVVFLVLAGLAANLGWPWYALCAGIGIILLWEHNLVRPDDLSRINTAFFTLNSIISPLVLLGAILGIWL